MPSSIASYLKRGGGPLLKSPAADGAAGEALITDGAGNLSFAAPDPAPHDHDADYDPLGAATAVNTSLNNHLSDTSAAHAASAISVVPAGSIAATDVQSVLAELDSEKAATGHHHDASYVPLSRALTAGNGLSGGGDLSSDRSFVVNVDDVGIEINSDALRLKDNGVTYAKLQDVSATQRLLARKTSGAGDVEECSLSEILDFIGSAAQGDILYRGASGWARLAAGTSGHYLKTQGTGANPTWAAVSAGSSEIDINTQSGNYTLQASDLGDLVDVTAAATLTLLAAATAGDKFYCWVRNSGAVTDVLTVDGNGSETVDGALTLAMYAGEVRLLICDGSNWTSIQIERPSLGVLTKPIDSGFAWINQGSASIVTTRGGLLLSCVSNGGAFSSRVRKKAAPSTPYTITACFVLDVAYGGIGYGGLCFRQTSDGKIQLFGISPDTGATYTASRKLTNATTYSADYSLASEPGRLVPGRLCWLRIADDGTSRICSFSNTGEDFITFHSVGRTDFLTADEVGFFVDPYSRETKLTLLSWKEA
jgi:hypothetical protein